ncbi:MAG TPA: glycolate oxidase subunit GlcF [Steroidobacteraceae bacterium]|jgi:glycolate oxidase iron-sulfur subunit|nr:glycolate oxidase subunit GlcF [Steroidobacteraceae bacterium]
MQTHLAPEFVGTDAGKEAAAILRKCVHCGFCNATCPTYQLTGDELDGPRGRIYLIKQLLEGADVTRSTQQHLDRCLTCLNCQTTCPSGVAFGNLVEIGRTLVEARVPRPPLEKAARWSLKEGLTSGWFAPALRLGQMLRPMLPKVLKDKVPRAIATRAPDTAGAIRSRKVLMLQGCVQPAMLPNIDRATIRVLDAAGIETIHAAGTGCCGALRTHLSDSKGGLDDMRRNIDAWSTQLSSGDVEAIISTASACTLAIKDYGHALAHDAAYAERAARVSGLARDLSELLPLLVPALKDKVRDAASRRAAFHAPCTLQHGQKLRGGVELHLRALGFDVSGSYEESHLCCGSAGTYSILQPQLARALRDRKLSNLAKLDAECILSANVGCIQHLQSGTSTPVMHWIEMLEGALN